MLSLFTLLTWYSSLITCWGVRLSTPQRRNIRILLRCVCKVVGGYMNIMHDKYDKDDCDYNDKKYEEYDNGKDENPLAWLLPE